MLPLYLASMGFGSVLIGVSLFFGGGDTDSDLDGDADVDIDHDLDLDGEVDIDHDLDLDGEVDIDHDVEAVDFGDAVNAELESISSDTGLADAIWIPIFSMRFWTFGSAAFGFTGTVLTFGSLPWIVAFIVATVFGATSGTLAAYFFRALKRDSVSGNTSSKGYAGEEAKAVLPILHGGRGKIILATPSGYVELVATTQDEEEIPVGAHVLIARVTDGVANVTLLVDHTDELSRRKRLTSNNLA